MRGGPSAHYDVSMQTGAAVLAAIRTKLQEIYDAIDVHIDRQGIWRIDGREVQPREAAHRFDIAWNALRGAYGEDGKVQSLLEAHGIPFTGSGSLGSAIGMNKALTKKILKDNGIKSPYWKEIPSKEAAHDYSAAAHKIFTTFLMPAVVKPATSGSSIGVSIVRTPAEIERALIEAAKHSDLILIEEFIPGIEATCGVIEGFRGQELYALPPVEIRPDQQHVVPTDALPADIKYELEELAKGIHRLLGLRHYSRTDFIVHPRRGIYTLETNTLPGMTKESLLPKALRAVGSDIHELIDHIVRRELGV